MSDVANCGTAVRQLYIVAETTNYRRMDVNDVRVLQSAHQRIAIDCEDDVSYCRCAS